MSTSGVARSRGTRVGWLFLVVPELPRCGRSGRPPSDAVGHPVLSLVRVQVGPISLGDTKPGKMRKLTKEEVGRLYTAAGM
jgi:hypothetical protein